MSRSASPFARLWRYAAPYRPQILLGSLFSFLNKVFDLAPPLLIGVAVDIVVAREASLLARWGVENLMTQLWLLAGVTILVWGLESVSEYVFGLYWRNLAQDVQHTLRVDSYAHVQGLELAYFEDRSTGGLMAILNDDINQLERFLDVGANDVIQVVTTVLVVGAIFFYLAPSVAWLAFLPVPIVIWGSFRFQRRIAPHYAEVRERVGDLSAQLGNNLSGVTTIKSFTAEARETARIGRESAHYRESNRRVCTAYPDGHRFGVYRHAGVGRLAGALRDARGRRVQRAGLYDPAPAVAPNHARPDLRPLSAGDGIIQAHLQSLGDQTNDERR